MKQEQIPNTFQYTARDLGIDPVEAWIVSAFMSVSQRKRPILAVGLSLLLAVGGAGAANILMNSSEPPVALGTDNRDGNKDDNPELMTPRKLLETSGLNGLERSFVDQMRLEGYSVHWVPVLGRSERNRMVSAGVAGSLVRPVPFSNEQRFPPVSAFAWGECFGWTGPEVVLIDERDRSVELYGPNSEGFVRLNKSKADGITEWFIDVDDPRCKALPDGAVDYGNGVIGPSLADQSRSK